MILKALGYGACALVFAGVATAYALAVLLEIAFLIAG